MGQVAHFSIGIEDLRHIAATTASPARRLRKPRHEHTVRQPGRNPPLGRCTCRNNRPRRTPSCQPPLGIGFNRLELLLDFAQAYEGRGELTHTRLVAAPAHVKQCAALMQGGLVDCEQRYGPTPGPASQDS